jgi:hypothetical protein
MGLRYFQVFYLHVFYLQIFYLHVFLAPEPTPTCAHSRCFFTFTAGARPYTLRDPSAQQALAAGARAQISPQWSKKGP